MYERYSADKYAQWIQSYFCCELTVISYHNLCLAVGSTTSNIWYYNKPITNSGVNRHLFREPLKPSMEKLWNYEKNIDDLE